MGRWKEAVATLAPTMPVAISILDDLAGFLSKTGDYNHACFCTPSLSSSLPETAACFTAQVTAI
jgi:hypothetical protein